MKVKTGQLNTSGDRRGSALILVVVLTVLLSVIGVLFVMSSRLNEMSTASITDNAELDLAVDAVVTRINTVLTEDLFGRATGGNMDLNLLAVPTPAGMRPDPNSLSPLAYAMVDIVNEPWDAPISAGGLGFGDDPWLASVEPVLPPLPGGGLPPYDPENNLYYWPHITNLWNRPWVDPGIPADIVDPQDDLTRPADADGDGVADSWWVPIPNMSSSSGKALYAAVKIVDNNAMLNLNVAHSLPPLTSQLTPENDGRYLSQLDYERFLRGRDTMSQADLDSIRRARRLDGIIDSVAKYHNNVVMKIEDPNVQYSLFDIGDELEIRNRFFLTSKVGARFEQKNVAHFTFAANGGIYSDLEIPIDYTNHPIPIRRWKVRMDHRNFEDVLPYDPSQPAPDPYYYDRRHVCTFYSFDKVIRRREYPFVDIEYDTEHRLIKDHILSHPEVAGIFMPRHGATSVTVDIRSNTSGARGNILHLLYAFRAYFIDRYPSEDYRQAARRAAQYVANMIDYIDEGDAFIPTEGPFYDVVYGAQENKNPTYINREIVKNLILEASNGAIDIDNSIDHLFGDTQLPIQNQFDFGLGIDNPAETVYGYERQPFISELYFESKDVESTTEIVVVAVELMNPYDVAISMEGWRFKRDDTEFAAFTVTSVGDPAVIVPSETDLDRLDRLIVSNTDHGGYTCILPGLESGWFTDSVLELQRPDPANPGEFITVDRTEPRQAEFLLTAAATIGQYSSLRDDTGWGFVDSGTYSHPLDPNSSVTLGSANDVSGLDGNGFQLPVPNDNERLATLHNFEMVTMLGTEVNSADPNDMTPITAFIAAALGEEDVRFDIANNPELLEYVCLMNRLAAFPGKIKEGTLPGRINVNTATEEVIRAALPAMLQFANPNALPNRIAAEITQYRPYKNLGDLLRVPAITAFVADPNDVGDPEIGDDIEERDWILSLVANKFTVRSDVFTAYILVRLGTDGPQRRMMAIFDRSIVRSPADRPRLVALHPVPDPR